MNTSKAVAAILWVLVLTIAIAIIVIATGVSGDNSGSTGSVLLVALGSTVCAFIVVGSIMLLGSLTGKGYTAASLARLKKQGGVRPEYEKFEDWTPAEFGMIIDGRCDRDEMIAEIMHLHFRGYITLEKGQNGKIIPKVVSGAGLQAASDIDKLLLGAIANDRLPDVWRFKEVVMDSLRAKEWVIERRSALGLAKKLWKWLAGLSVAMQIFLGTVYALFVMPAIGLLVIVITMGDGDLFTYMRADSAVEVYGMALMFGGIISLLLVILGLPVLLAIAAAIYAFVESFKGVTIIARNYSPKYKQHYTDVLGLHQYLVVSGMDTMTPDYQALNFKGLDPLYPYAVAAGLDKTIARMF